MVFEHLFPESFLEKRHWAGFVLAAIYSTISIFLARLLFPANSGIVSVVFVSIFLIPYFETILKREELQVLNDKKKTFVHLFKDNSDALLTYVFIFLGIYLTYMAYAFLAPTFGFDTGVVFREQLSLEGVRGGATFSFDTFFGIFNNNWWVLLACFLIALIAGDGAIFFIAWNASTWGTIFGYRAVSASVNTGESAILMLLIIIVITLPHLLLEGGAYILAAFSGGLISDQIDKIDEIRNFVFYVLSAGIVFFLFFMIEKSLFGQSVVASITLVITILVILHSVHFVLSDPEDNIAFRYNFYLFVFAILLFLLGAFIETLVLYNATPLRDVYFAAAGF